MSRELPFDDDADAGDHASDAAYRVATGVARVARAGAYVTGGALIASNGSPAPENESHNSHITGWSTADPHQDAPSPVVTYPDPSPDSVPPDLGTSAPNTPPAAAPAPVDPPAAHGYSGFQVPYADGRTVAPGAGETPGDGSYTLPGTDYTVPGAGYGFDGTEYANPGYYAGQDFWQPGRHPAAAPAHDAVPGAGAATGRGDGFGMPGADPHPTAPLPGHGMGLPGTNGLHLPGMNGFGPGGFGLEHGLSDAQPAPFDGIGEGGRFGVFLETDMKVDAHIGLDGIWMTAQTTVDVTVGDVGHQLDDFGQWLGPGTQQIAEDAAQSGTSWAGQFGRANPDPAQAGEGGAAPAIGAADPAAASAVPTSAGHSSAGHSSAGHSSAAASSGSAGAVPGGSVPAPQSGPMAAASAPGGASAFAPGPASAVPTVAVPQPVSPTPVVAAPTPPPPPAPVPVQPVSTTPLQTTIQPEAASHPIANVITAHPGPSPLTAPAVAVPALFDDRPRHLGTDAELPGRHGGESSGSIDPTPQGPTTTAKSGPGTAHDVDPTRTPAAPTTPSAGHSGLPTVGGHPTTRPGTSSEHDRPTTSTGHDSTGSDTTDRTTPTVTLPRDTDSDPTGTRTPGATTSNSDAGQGDSGRTGTHSPSTSSGADTAAPGTADGSTTPSAGSGLPGTDQDSVPTRELPTPDVPTQHSTPSHDQTLPTREPTLPTGQHGTNPTPDTGGIAPHTVPMDPPTVVKPPTTIDPAPGAHIAPVKPAAHAMDAYDVSLWSDTGTGPVSTSAGLTGGLHESAYSELHHSAVHPVPDFHLSL
ncbi:hypothetical protein [Nocardia veterana]|uniref:Uncharacterized protein n=1 Tax=Nocardia veterana TaxID=132249 RepID=A0A7X6LV06_9NOCA|nr:hypothetical protein [Nocardia veterana]NKY84584.1 hypothetical protein [Nocardia veterana]